MSIGLRVLALLLVIAGGAGGFWYWRNSQQTSDDSQLVVFGNVDVRQVLMVAIRTRR